MSSQDNKIISENESQTTQKESLIIYAVKTYKDLESNKQKKAIEGSINNICNILTNQNEGYHLKLKKSEYVILFGDSDHIPDEIIFDNFLDELSKFFIIEKDDISYSLSKKDDKFS